MDAIGSVAAKARLSKLLDRVEASDCIAIIRRAMTDMTPEQVERAQVTRGW